MYQHVSEAHLHRYLSEFDFRYSNREKLGVNDTARASIALKGAKGRRLTYETTHSMGAKAERYNAIASDIGTGTTSGNCGCHLKIEPLTAVLS